MLVLVPAMLVFVDVATRHLHEPIDLLPGQHHSPLRCNGPDEGSHCEWNRAGLDETSI